MNARGSSLAGRRVLITGAARGIGAALAERLHQRGARVALAGLEDDLLAEAAAKADATWWHCDAPVSHIGGAKQRKASDFESRRDSTTGDKCESRRDSPTKLSFL